MIKLKKTIFFILFFNFLLIGISLAQSNQEPPASPQVAALKKRIERGEQKTVEDFWREVSRQGTPLVEAIKDDEKHVLVTFLWRAQGEIKNVYLFSYALTFPDAIGLTQGQMTHLPDTDIWFKTFTIRDDARFSYVFSPNDSLLPDDQARRMANLQPDPFNRRRFADLESPQASVCELPKAKPQIWTTRQEGITSGKVEQHKFKSKILNNERSVFVYTPPHYKATDKAYPLVMLFDGYTYTTMVPTPTILDNLIARGEIPPVVAVFVDSISIPVRLRELHCDENFSRFLVKELIPWIRHTYRVTSNPEKTIVSGSSAGGLMAAFVGLKHSEIFGNVMSQSGSFSWKPGLLERFLNNGQPGPFNEGRYADSGWLIKQYAASPKRPLKFYIDVGLFEDLAPRKPLQAGDNSQAGDFSGLVANRYFRDVLIAKGYQVDYREFNSGHSYLNAPNSLADGLISLFGRNKNRSVRK